MNGRAAEEARIYLNKNASEKENVKLIVDF